MEAKEKTALEKLEIYYQQQVREYTGALEFIQTNRELLAKANVRPCLWYDYADFDNLSRPDIVRLLRVFGGKWDKEPAPTGGQLRYTRKDKLTGRIIRLSGEPPATCKIVETVKYVRVPAKRERVVTRTVVCK